MNWNQLVQGSYTRDEIQDAVKDLEWQELRINLLGTDMTTRYSKLLWWLESHEYSRQSKVQVTNYVNALKRGGLIK